MNCAKKRASLDIGAKTTSRQMARINPWVIIIFICCLIDLSISLPTPLDKGSPCFNCKELNRKWKTSQCTTTENDCGDCLDGYSRKQDASECILDVSAQVTINDGQYVAVLQGSSVTINCQFKKAVDCAWKRGDQYVVINGRYQYVNNKGIKTKDCSIQIDALSTNDQGLWSCQSLADSFSEGRQSTSAWLTMKDSRLSMTVKEKETAFVPLGETVLLPCHFPGQVYCTWKRAGNYVEISGRYAFIDSRKNGKDTRDCSIRIQDIAEIDIAKWECESMAGARQQAIAKSPMVLQAVKNILVQYVKSPQNQTVEIGDRVVLECQLNYDVHCNWERNGQRVTVTDRYRYLNPCNGLRTKNCGIEISDFKPEDAGSWTCNHQNDVTVTRSPPNAAELRVEPSVTITRTATEITCSATNGYPEPRIRWTPNDSIILDTKNIKGKDGLFNLYSTITIDKPMNDVIRCFVEHPTFPGPREMTIQDLAPCQDDIIKPKEMSIVTLTNSGRSHSFKPEVISYNLMVMISSLLTLSHGFS